MCVHCLNKGEEEPLAYAEQLKMGILYSINNENASNCWDVNEELEKDGCCKWLSVLHSYKRCETSKTSLDMRAFFQTPPIFSWVVLKIEIAGLQVHLACLNPFFFQEQMDAIASLVTFRESAFRIFQFEATLQHLLYRHSLLKHLITHTDATCTSAPCGPQGSLSDSF